jgi:hypothetical protein
MEIPLKPISLPTQLHHSPKAHKSIKETRHRNTVERQTDRQIERQERAWKVVVVLQTHSKDEKQEGMRERSPKTNPKRMASKSMGTSSFL